MLFPTLPALAAALTTIVAGAQDASLRPGDLLYNGADQQVKVLQCRPVIYGRECETVGWEAGRATSNPSWWDEQMLLKGDARVRQALNLPPRSGGGAAPRGPAVSPARARPAGQPAATQRTAPPAPTPAATRVPDGSYRCQFWMGGSYVDLGVVRSVGGKLTPNPLAKVGATITGVQPSAEGITINYMTARGYRESMDCKR